MTAFEKARAEIERMIEEHGAPPEQVDLVKYPDAEIFAALNPGEDYASHLAQREEMVIWLKALGVRVVDRKAKRSWPNSKRDRAQKISKPYRLGIELGHGSVSFFAIGLAAGEIESGEL